MRTTYANFISLVRFFGLFLANANLANANFFPEPKVALGKNSLYIYSFSDLNETKATSIRN